jgi:hypothetical protein
MDEEMRGLLDTLRNVLGFNEHDSSRLVRILSSCGALASGVAVSAALLLTKVQRAGMGAIDARLLVSKILAVGAAYAVPYTMCHRTRNKIDELMQVSKAQKSDTGSIAQLKMELDKLLRMDAEANRSGRPEFLI